MNLYSNLQYKICIQTYYGEIIKKTKLNVYIKQTIKTH